ncbi:MAG: hypothetical protein ACBZ72_10140 [Candidatus Bathyarchaeia archaeon]|jgi:threonine/homoserine/homoserine lactone efflux protein
MNLNQRQVTRFLFAAEGVGAAFVGVFLAAYLSGLPSTAVLHSEPAFRVPLAILGGLFLLFVAVAGVLAARSPK